MNVLRPIATTLPRRAAWQAGLFVLAWLVMAASPCVMALGFDAAGDAAEPGTGCPHCPPAPCHEVQADDCDDGLEMPRPTESAKFAALIPTHRLLPASVHDPAGAALLFSTPPVRAGPRTHLFHVQFNE